MTTGRHTGPGRGDPAPTGSGEPGPGGVPGAADPEPPGRIWPEHLRPGRVSEVAPGVRRVIAPNPGYMTGPGTNTYLVGGDRLALLDPGPDDDAHLDCLLETAGDRLLWILVTHTHVDHAPLSTRLAERTGAEVIAFGPPPRPGPGGQGGDAHYAAFAAHRLFADGDRLDGGDFVIEAVHTPGHTSNHLCFELVDQRLLFSGDHVMDGSTVVIAPPDGDMATYMESLQKVRARTTRRIAPGHGDMIDDPAAVLDEYLRHRRGREAEVLSVLAPGVQRGINSEVIVDLIYQDLGEELRKVARLTVWAHLRKLGSEGRASTPDRDDPEAPWYLAPPAAAREPEIF